MVVQADRITSIFCPVSHSSRFRKLVPRDRLSQSNCPKTPWRAHFQVPSFPAKHPLPLIPTDEQDIETLTFLTLLQRLDEKKSANPPSLSPLSPPITTSPFLLP